MSLRSEVEDGDMRIVRPEVRLGLVCLALVVGEAVGLASGGFAALWPVSGLAALTVLSLGFARGWRHWPFGFFLLLGLTLAMRATDVRCRALREVGMRNGPYEVVCRVEGEPRIGAEDAQGVRWVSFPTAYPGGKLTVVMQWPVTNAVPRFGETWSCTGWMSRQEEEGGRGACLWVRGRGSRAALAGGADPWSPSVVLARLKHGLSRRLGIGLEDRPDVADLHRAMLLGERKNLVGEMRETFTRAGTIHVFAISGLHVMVVGQLILYALVLCLFPIRWAGVVLVPLLWLYVAMIGAPPSAVRAAAMAAVYGVAPLFWRRPDGMTAWEVTLVGFALVDPVGLFGVGSQLSFTVMLAILLAVRWARPLGSRLAATLGVPFAAWAAGVPIVAHYFGSISVGGLVANLVTVPIAAATVLTGALGLLASFVSDVLAAHVNNLAALFTEAMVGLSWAVAQIPGSSGTLVPWTLATCLAWYAGIILLYVWIRMVWLRRRNAL